MTQPDGLERGLSSPGIRVAYSSLPRRAAHPTAASAFLDEHLLLVVEQPDWYPLEIVHRGGPLLCLEGHIYGGRRAALLKNLGDLRANARDDETFVRDLRSRVEDVDGDFALLWYDRATARLAIAADRFGRCPLYHGEFAGGVAISRDQAFVLAQRGRATIDATALAQLLLLGYPLGPRTLTDGVSRLLPGEVLVASPHGWRLFPAPGSPFRRGADANVARDLAGNARRLRDAFVESCRDRNIAAGSHVLSLSGGIDSRATGAGMRAALPSFSAVTFAAPGSGRADERDVAAAAARLLGAAWRSYEFDHASPACIDGIIRMKLGLNPVDVAFGIDYVKSVQSDFPGPVAFWTGEGADKLLCEHRAIPRRPRLDELVGFILDKNAVLEPSRVAALTGVREDELVASLRSVVAADDIEPEDAYVHFLLSQRVVRFHTEGEDRHRAAVWPVSPFFASGFFALARAIPPEMKRERRLYRAFLNELAPDLALLRLADGHAAPASRRFALEYALRDRLRNNRHTSALHRRVRAARGARRAQGGPWHATLVRLLKEGAIPENLRASEIESIVSGRTPASPFALCMILTATLALRTIRGDAALPSSARPGSP